MPALLQVKWVEWIEQLLWKLILRIWTGNQFIAAVAVHVQHRHASRTQVEFRMRVPHFLQRLRRAFQPAVGLRKSGPWYQKQPDSKSGRPSSFTSATPTDFVALPSHCLLAKTNQALLAGRDGAHGVMGTPFRKGRGKRRNAQQQQTRDPRRRPGRMHEPGGYRESVPEKGELAYGRQPLR